MHTPSLLTFPGSCISSFCLPVLLLEASRVYFPVLFLPTKKMKFLLVVCLVLFACLGTLAALKPAWPSLVPTVFATLMLQTDVAFITSAREESCSCFYPMLHTPVMACLFGVFQYSSAGAIEFCGGGRRKCCWGLRFTFWILCRMWENNSRARSLAAIVSLSMSVLLPKISDSALLAR